MFLPIFQLMKQCEVSTSGLQCLEGNRVFCTCGNCMEISGEFGRNLERCQLRNVKLRQFFNSLLFECEPFVESDSDSASSCVVDVPGTVSELGDSEENLEVAACQLCDLNFGWLQDDTNHVDSGLLCSMFESDDRDFAGTQSETAAGPLHQAVRPTRCGDFMQSRCRFRSFVSKLSSNSSQKFGISTFFNLQDTVSHAGAQNDRFRAANGSKVSIDGSASVSVWVGFKKKHDNLGRTPICRQAKLKCLVGGISHNIISTNTLCECGWEFNQNPEGTEVTHCESGLRLADICNFGGCPWVRLDPASGSEVSTQQYLCNV